MGDPGLPIIVGVLAVPVCVLLFVLGLAVMGRRWATAGAGAPTGGEFTAAGALPGTGHPAAGADGLPAPAARHEPAAAGAYGRPATDAYGLPLDGAYRPPSGAGRHRRDASAGRLDLSEDAVYGQAPYGRPEYGQAPYGQPQYGQAPYGQAPYGEPAHGRPAYGHGGADEPAGWAPYVPPARPAPESARAVRPPEPPAYGPSDRQEGWDAADRRWYRPADPWDLAAPDRPAADRPDRETEPPQGFTYGPYV